MSCVVGIETVRGVLLAGDAQWSSENYHHYDKTAKAVAISPVLAMAYVGSGRLAQIGQYFVAEGLDDPPLRPPEVDDEDVEHRWVVREFVPHLIEMLRDHGHLHILEETQVEQMGESAFLLAVRHKLFTVESDFSINQHVNPYEALGSGEVAAIGSLHAELGVGGEPLASWERAERIAIAAIEAAHEYTNFVGGDITMVSTVNYTPEEKALARSILA